MTQTMTFCPQCSSKLDIRQFEGKPYSHCYKCHFTHWNNPTPVVAAIVELEGNIILVRNKGWPDKVLGLVTGFLEQNEDPEQAVVREVKEELNLNTLETNLIGAYGFSEQNQVIIAYHLICQGDVLLNHELEAYKALPFEKVKPWSFGTGLAVRDWLSMRRKK